jgi:proline iminopeptidase
MRRFVYLVLLVCMGAAPDPVDVPVTSGDVTISAHLVGARGQDTIVVIPGGPGLSYEYLLPLAELASARQSVVFYDPRGVGGSTRPTDGNYSLAAQADDIEAIRTTIGAPRIHLLGHSWGTVIALAYAAVHPNRVASVVLVGMGPPTEESDRRAFGAAFAARKEKLMKAGFIPHEHPADCARAFDAILPAHFADPQHPAARSLPGTYRCDTGHLTRQAAGEWDFRRDLEQLAEPILLVTGDADVNRAGLEETWKLVEPNGGLRVVLGDCGHFPFIECPGSFFPAVRRFLAQL